MNCQERFNTEEIIKILGLEMRAEQADEGRDFDVACRIALQKLRKCKNYEDLEEQGVLLHLTECELSKIEIKPTIYGKISYFAEPTAHRGCLYRYFENDFGRTIFLKKTEAEQKLNEIKEANGNHGITE